MSDRPILFSAPMVRALLDGSKTQTRRAVKSQPVYDGRFAGGWKLTGKAGHEAAVCSPLVAELCPYGQPGDQLWVRETFMDLRGTGVEHRPDPHGPLHRYAFGADSPLGSLGDEARKDFGLKWRPSIHMPRAASRITLEITGVRVERLQDISEVDAIAEGIAPNWIGDLAAGPNGFGGQGWVPDCGWRHYLNSVDGDPAYTAVESYRSLWESINGEGSWAANSWVWVVEFKRVGAAA